MGVFEGMLGIKTVIFTAVDKNVIVCLRIVYGRGW